jgi:hypothetical protein
MDLPPPYPGPQKKQEAKEEECFSNMHLPPPPAYDGLEGQRIIITEAPMMISPHHGQRILIPPVSQQPARIESYLILSLFTLLCCCFPLGLIATVLSCQVGLYAQRGEIKKARYVSEKAKHIATIGILIGTLTLLYMCIQKVKFFEAYRFVTINDDIQIARMIPTANETAVFLNNMEN